MKRIQIIIVMIILFLSGCTKKIKKEEPIDNTRNIMKYIVDSRGVDFTEPIEIEYIGPLGPDKNNLEDIKSKYPDKEVLIISNNIGPAGYITDTVNDYLQEQGTDYVVYFHIADERELKMLFLENREEELMYEYLDSSDIISLSRSYYMKFIKEGLIEEWNTYLESEEGKALYSSMPVQNWNYMTRDNVIYGICGYEGNVSRPPSYDVNVKLMEEYGITPSDLNHPLYELMDIIDTLMDKMNNKYFKPIILESSFQNSYFLGMSKYLVGGAQSVGLYHDPTINAKMVLEDEEYLRWLECINELVKKGYVETYKGKEKVDDFFMVVNYATALPAEGRWEGVYYNSVGEFATDEDIIEVLLDDYYDARMNINWRGNVISRASTKKEYAFDFLSRLYTDANLSNLVLFGIEGRNYLIEDGKVFNKLMHISNSSIGNNYITYPRFFEYENKNDIYWNIVENTPDPYYDFVFDPILVQKEINTTNSVLSKLDHIMYGGVKDFDGFINNLKKELYESGVEKIIDEVERQKNLWLEGRR